MFKKYLKYFVVSLMVVFVMIVCAETFAKGGFSSGGRGGFSSSKSFSSTPRTYTPSKAPSNYKAPSSQSPVKPAPKEIPKTVIAEKQKSSVPQSNYSNGGTGGYSPSYTTPSSGFSFGDAAIGYLVGNAIFGGNSAHSQPQVIHHYHDGDKPASESTEKQKSEDSAEVSKKGSFSEQSGCTQKMKDNFECF